ncbi:MAG: DEAD/DEAH box helicase, partial [Ignavibacteria bacterium]|nr:DEAD/DEAH box helicase [Ignavibacteria bacterium]
FGKKQHPTVKGRIDRRLTWPVFKPGLAFREAFPESARPKVTSDIQSLAPYGFSSEILSAWAGVIPSLNPLQLSAINEFNVLNGEHLVVSAPTSSGKTMIGELAALRGILSRKRTIFLLPLKALVNDKQGQFQNLYGSFGVRTIQATGDSTDDIPDLIRGQYDICLMTYEKFTALVFGFPNILEQVGIVVIDEVQMIADRSRGMNLEFILTLLRTRRQHGIEPQLIALSAVIGETNGLERWLDARLLCRTERPVPLDEGIIRADGSFRYIDAETSEEKVTQNYIQRIFRKDSNQDWVIPLVQKLVGEGKQVIVFREKKGEARGAANYLGEALNLPPAQSALDALPSGDPSIISEVLEKCLHGGVAFHTSDLDRDERLVIEEQFRQPNSEIRVIAATTTLAMGVNMPAEAVVVVGLEHPNPQDGPQPYFVAEYKNITGRAGRLGLVDRGTSYLLALTPREEHDFWSRYVLGNPEDIKSQFLSDNTDPRSLIVRVLVAARRLGGGKFFGMTDNDIIAFLEGSFGAFQQTQLAENWKWDANRLKEALNNLESHELVRQDEKGIYRLTALGWLAGQGGVEVESITRLVDALRPLEPGSITDQTLIALTQLTVELDDVLFPVNSRGAGKELATWSQELQSQAIPQSVLQQLQRHTADTYQTASRFKKATACLLWVTDMPLVQIEEVLTKHGGRFNGAAGPTRSVSSRTHDILPIVARVAEILHKDLDLTERSARLFTRLEVGIPSSIIDLAKQAGARLSRADYQSLLKSNLSQIEDIQNSSDEDLLACVNDNRTKLSIIRQAVIDHYEQKIDENLSFPLLPEYEG